MKMVKYQGKGVYGAIAIGKALKWKCDDVQVKREKIEDAARNHNNLKSHVTRKGGGTVKAFSLADHCGYDTWHRNYDKKIVNWIKNNDKAYRTLLPCNSYDKNGSLSAHAHHTFNPYTINKINGRNLTINISNPFIWLLL